MTRRFARRPRRVLPEMDDMPPLNNAANDETDETKNSNDTVEEVAEDSDVELQHYDGTGMLKREGLYGQQRLIILFNLFI